MMDEDITYFVDAKLDGTFDCSVICLINEDGDLSSSISKAIRRVLGLGPGEEPIYEVDKEDRIIIKKNKKTS